MAPEPLLRPEEAAARIDRPLGELIELAEAGRIASVWIGRQRRFFPDELEITEPAESEPIEPEPEPPQLPRKPPAPKPDVDVDAITAACVEASGIRPWNPCVYVIQAGPDGPIKVGYVRKVRTLRSRLRELQGGCPAQLVPLFLFPGGVYAESEYHSLLAEYRIRGEWFARSALAVLVQRRRAQ